MHVQPLPNAYSYVLNTHKPDESLGVGSKSGLGEKLTSLRYIPFQIATE
jgi:hypothetical protein